MELVQIYFIKLDKHAVSVKFWSLQPHLLYYWLVASFTRQEYWSLQLHLNYSSTVLCSPIYSTGVLISVGLIYTRGVLIFAALFTLQKYWHVASFTLGLLHFCVYRIHIGSVVSWTQGLEFALLLKISHFKERLWAICSLKESDVSDLQRANLLKTVFWIRIRPDPHKEMLPGSGSRRLKSLGNVQIH